MPYVILKLIYVYIVLRPQITGMPIDSLSMSWHLYLYYQNISFVNVQAVNYYNRIKDKKVRSRIDITNGRLFIHEQNGNEQAFHSRTKW